MQLSHGRADKEDNDHFGEWQLVVGKTLFCFAFVVFQTMSSYWVSLVSLG